MVGFWETVLITFFGLSFHMATDPYRVSNPHSRTYVGVGAFQMLKRSAYEAAGTHRRLAMEVVDDMKLGKIVKLAGLRSGVAVAQDLVAVRWHAGPGNLIRGVTKNFFASARFSLWQVSPLRLPEFCCSTLRRLPPCHSFTAGCWHWRRFRW
jgi:hypothetical protein